MKITIIINVINVNVTCCFDQKSKIKTFYLPVLI